MKRIPGFVILVALCASMAGAVHAQAEKSAQTQTGTDSGKQTGAYAGDSAITAKVRAALVKDPDIKALDVSVDTYKGEVLLSGFVENPQQARKAAEITARVRGVTSVKNALVAIKG